MLAGTTHRWTDDERAEWADTPRDIVGPSAGVDGRPYIAGKRPSEYEHNASLRANRQRVLTYEKMIRESVAVMVGLGIVADTLMTARLTVVRSERTNPEAADALAEQFGLDEYVGAGRLEQTSDDILRYFAGGAAIGSLTLAESWVEADGRYWLDRYDYRWPGSLECFYFDESGRLIAIEQAPTAWTWGAGISDRDRRIMPINRVMHAVRWPERGGQEGFGLLRPCYGPWRTDAEAARQTDVCTTRYSTPSPVAKIDAEVAMNLGLDKDEIKSERDTWDTALKEYIGHERGRLVLPPWVTLDYYGGSRIFDPAALTAVRLAAQREILMAFGAAYLTIGGAGSSGSYSAAEVQYDTAERATKNLLDWAVASLRQTVTRFLDANFGPDLPAAERPALGYTGVDVKGFVRDLPTVLKAFELGVLTPQESDEDAIRLGFDLPTLTDETRAAASQQMRAATQRVVGRARPRASDLLTEATR